MWSSWSWPSFNFYRCPRNCSTPWISPKRCQNIRSCYCFHLSIKENSCLNSRSGICLSSGWINKLRIVITWKSNNMQHFMQSRWNLGVNVSILSQICVEFSKVVNKLTENRSIIGRQLNYSPCIGKISFGRLICGPNVNAQIGVRYSCCVVSSGDSYVLNWCRSQALGDYQVALYWNNA